MRIIFLFIYSEASIHSITWFFVFFLGLRFIVVFSVHHHGHGDYIYMMKQYLVGSWLAYFYHISGSTIESTSTSALSFSHTYNPHAGTARSYHCYKSPSDRFIAAICLHEHHFKLWNFGSDCPHRVQYME